MFNLVDFVDRAVDAVDSVDFNKIDRVEVDFVASVYEARCSNDCATTESYTIPLLESSYDNIPSCS